MSTPLMEAAALSRAMTETMRAGTLGYADVPVVPDLAKLAKEQADKVVAAAAAQARPGSTPVSSCSGRPCPSP